MKHFKKILYVLGNHTEQPSASLLRAIALAKSNQADLSLLQVLPDVSSLCKSEKIGLSENQLLDKISAQQNAKLQQLIESLNEDFSFETEQIMGIRYIEIIRLVLAKNFDLVVKEADDIDWIDRLLGSDDKHLLRACPCPVLLLKKDQDFEYKHIMAAVDFDSENDEETHNDELSSKIVKLASSLSLAEFTTLHVVNIYDVPHAGYVSLWVENPDRIKSELYDTEYQKKQAKMNDLMDRLKDKIGAKAFDFLSPQTYTLHGTPDRELSKIASEIKADLVVMGTVARTGIAGVIIGNTAEAVLSELQCSVLAIKPEGFVCPVS